MSKIMITGGTGFLGKRLGKALKLMGHDVVLVGRNNKQNLSAMEFSGCKVYAADVSRIESFRDVVNQINPSVIIHAAATKFVDLSEKQPMEAVDVNVVGSQNVARVAIEKGVKLVIGISTDKAAPPIRNTYGLTKALMERMFCAIDSVSNTRFLCVRYGNVAWSTGSVLCIWRKMLRDAKMIQTTGADMFRFFFTVDDAVQLVLTALSHAPELYGKVVGRYMKSAKMEDILKIWVAQEGANYRRVESRPGERNEEFLVGDQELPYTTTALFNNIKHYIISFNQKAPQPLPEVLSSRNAERLSEDEIRSLINNPPLEEVIL